MGGENPVPPLKGPLTDPKPNILIFLAYLVFFLQLTICPWVMIFYQNQNQNFYFLLIPVFWVGDYPPQGGRTIKMSVRQKFTPFNLQYAPDCVPCKVLFKILYFCYYLVFVLLMSVGVGGGGDNNCSALSIKSS